MGGAQYDWLKLSILTKSLYAKLLAWSYARSYSPKKLGFAESGLINRSCSIPERSCLFK